MKPALIGLCFCFSMAPVLSSVPRYAAQQTSATAPTATVWNAVYTQAQAKRGQEQYDVHCTSCHGADMQGDGADVPALSDLRFARKWTGRTLKQLFELISQRMPENRPATLSNDAYADVLAYILQVNGFPAGVRALPDEPDTLARILFEETAPDGQR